MPAASGQACRGKERCCRTSPAQPPTHAALHGRRAQVAPKLEKLERRTQRALIDIMQDEERRRLEEEGVQD